MVMASPQSSQTMSSGNGVPYQAKEHAPNTPQSFPTLSNSSGAPRRINEYFQFDNFIKISVGPNRVPWTLNKELACDRIPTLRRAAQASSSDRQTLCLKLQEDPTVFAFIIDWALTLKLDAQFTHEFPDDTANEEQLALLCGIYECSHRMGMDTLSLEVLDQIKRCLRHRQPLPSPKALAFIYSKTPVDGPVQQVIGEEVVEALLKASREEVSNQILQWADIVTSHRGLTVQFLLAVNRGKDIAEPRKIETRKRKAANVSGKHVHRPPPVGPNTTVIDLISNSSEGSK